MAPLNLKVLITAVDRLTGPVRKISRVLKVELAGAARIGGNALRSMAGWATKAAGALGALGGVSFGAITTGVLKVGSQFENYRTVLETIEGSQAKAEASMRWVEEFAKKTPYELSEVMEAFVALKAYGIDPTDGTLETLGNTASAMNKRLMQAVEMYADAQTGEFERLKEFGVRGSAAGEQVRLTYQKAGKEVVATSAKSADAIRRNLLGIFDSRFAGTMDRQSKTLSGVWANLLDMITSFQRQIADAGVFEFVKGELQALLDQINVMAANGKLTEWAKEISDKLVELLTSVKMLITGVDWVEFTKAVIGVANAFATVIRWIGGFEGLITTGVGAAIGWLTSALMGVGVAVATALGVATAPVALAIAIIGLIALAAWFIYRNWQEIWELLKAGWKGFVDWLGGLGKWLSAAFTVAVDMVWKVLPAWFRAAISGGGMVIKAVTSAISGPADPARRPPPPPGDGGNDGGRPGMPRPAVGPNGRPQQVGVGVDVRVRHDGPPSVRTRTTGATQTNTNYRGGGVD